MSKIILTIIMKRRLKGKNKRNPKEKKKKNETRINNC